MASNNPRWAKSTRVTIDFNVLLFKKSDPICPFAISIFNLTGSPQKLNFSDTSVISIPRDFQSRFCLCQLWDRIYQEGGDVVSDVDENEYLPTLKVIQKPGEPRVWLCTNPRFANFILLRNETDPDLVPLTLQHTICIEKAKAWRMTPDYSEEQKESFPPALRAMLTPTVLHPMVKIFKMEMGVVSRMGDLPPRREWTQITQKILLCEDCCLCFDRSGNTVCTFSPFERFS